MIRLTDIGVNLMNSAFDRDRDAVLSRAQAAGVTTFIITGNSIESSLLALKYAEGYRHIKATAGVHPHNAKNWNKDVYDRLRILAGNTMAAAIGECGLDYNRNFSPRDSQIQCYEDQLTLAAELGKPVFLHERDASADFSAILKKYRHKLPGAVVHCFTGTEEELETYLDMDCHIGITGWICDERRGVGLRPIVKKIPANRLLLETDAPYLLPRNLPQVLQKKSGRNEPCFLSHIAHFIAEILGKTPEQLAAETSANAACLFSLSV